MAEYCMNRIPHNLDARVTDISIKLKLLEEEWKKKKSN
jgi:hypothetical protein